MSKTPGRIPDLHKTELNAEYWTNGADKAKTRAEALLCLHQAVNAWKNAAYAMADQRDLARQEVNNLEDSLKDASDEIRFMDRM